MRLLPSLLAASLCAGGLAHWTAAAAQEPGCHLVVFSRPNLEGSFRPIFGDVPDLERLDFNNKISSFVIVKGRWRFFRGRDYDRRTGERMGPGVYPNLEAVGIKENRISSARCRDD